MTRDDDIGSAKTALGTNPSLPAGTNVPDAPPSVIAERYEVLALLGAGGMGRVYRAHDRTLDEDVALKLLRRELLDTPGVLERFRQEVKLARRVTHAHVVRTFDLGQHGHDHYLTMEFIEGRSLAHHLDDGLLALDEVLRIARAACAGIAAAHAAGVVHFDLKPDNVLVVKSGRVAITDFGIARAAADPGRTLDKFAGTPAYMAPEQVEGQEAIGAAADVYAFGAILFEMITGVRPFRGNDPIAVALARLRQPPPDPREHCAVPEPLAELVVRCRARDPAARLADGAALATELAAIDASRMVARLAPAQPQSVVPAKTSRAVALLPLRASGDLAEIAEGLSEEIVDALTNTRALRVRPLASVRAASGDGDVQAVGRALGVDVVVDGSIRRRGEQVRIAARAIGVVDGFQLWASHVDTGVAGLLAASDEIASAIARALTVEIDVPVRGVTDARAAELYLESKARLRIGWNDGNLDGVVDALDRARGLAPDDASILATLAMALSRLAFYGQTQNLPRARELAERAVALAPTSGEAHLALGLSHLYALEVPAAARAIAAAVMHAPGLGMAQALLGALLLEADALDLAISHLEGAQAIDPHGPQANDLPRAYIYAGRPDDADAVLRMFPGDPLLVEILRARFSMWRGESYELASGTTEPPPNLGEFLDFIRRIHRTRRVEPADRPRIDANIRAPNPRLRATRAQFFVEYMMFAGEVDAAMGCLALSVESGLQDYCWCVRCPVLAPLRDRADFQELEAVVAGRARDVIAAVRAGLGR